MVRANRGNKYCVAANTRPYQWNAEPCTIGGSLHVLWKLNFQKSELYLYSCRFYLVSFIFLSFRYFWLIWTVCLNICRLLNYPSSNCHCRTIERPKKWGLGSSLCLAAAAALGREGAVPWLTDFVGPSKVGQRGEVEEAPYARQVSADRPPAAAPRLQAAGCAQVTPEVASIHLLAGAAGAEAGGRGEGGVGEWGEGEEGDQHQRGQSGLHWEGGGGGDEEQQDQCWWNNQGHFLMRWGDWRRGVSGCLD